MWVAAGMLSSLPAIAPAIDFNVFENFNFENRHFICIEFILQVDLQPSSTISREGRPEKLYLPLTGLSISQQS